MQLKAWYMWASSCNFPNPVSKDLLHCINIVRVVTYQRSRHRLVPSASVCRNMYCNSYYLPFGRKTGIRCRPFHGDNLTWLFYYHWFSTDAECTARRLHDWILISEQLKTTCQERRRERERESESEREREREREREIEISQASDPQFWMCKLTKDSLVLLQKRNADRL